LCSVRGRSEGEGGLDEVLDVRMGSCGGTGCDCGGCGCDCALEGCARGGRFRLCRKSSALLGAAALFAGLRLPDVTATAAAASCFLRSRGGLGCRDLSTYRSRSVLLSLPASARGLVLAGPRVRRQRREEVLRSLQIRRLCRAFLLDCMIKENSRDIERSAAK